MSLFVFSFSRLLLRSFLKEKCVFYSLLLWFDLIPTILTVNLFFSRVLVFVKLMGFGLYVFGFTKCGWVSFGFLSATWKRAKSFWWGLLALKF